MKTNIPTLQLNLAIRLDMSIYLRYGSRVWLTRLQNLETDLSTKTTDGYMSNSILHGFDEGFKRVAVKLRWGMAGLYRCAYSITFCIGRLHLSPDFIIVNHHDSGVNVTVLPVMDADDFDFCNNRG